MKNLPPSKFNLQVKYCANAGHVVVVGAAAVAAAVAAATAAIVM